MNQASGYKYVFPLYIFDCLKYKSKRKHVLVLLYLTFSEFSYLLLIYFLVIK